MFTFSEKLNFNKVKPNRFKEKNLKFCVFSLDSISNKEDALKRKKKILAPRSASEMETNLNKGFGTGFHRDPRLYKGSLQETLSRFDYKSLRACAYIFFSRKNPFIAYNFQKGLKNKSLVKNKCLLA